MLQVELRQGNVWGRYIASDISTVHHVTYYIILYVWMNWLSWLDNMDTEDWYVEKVSMYKYDFHFFCTLSQLKLSGTAMYNLQQDRQWKSCS